MGQGTYAQESDSTEDEPVLTREELLDALADILEEGLSSHTDAVNGLIDLLESEADKEPNAEWAQKFRAVLPE